jgi:hypothetical protein
MWTYEQPSGKLFDPAGVLIAIGYSGAVGYKNNARFQDVADKGPCPCGLYAIGYPEDSPKHGPVAIPLTPDPANQMFDRSAFYIHGDNVHIPGTASEGCIIMPRFARDRIVASKEKTLQVVLAFQPVTQV